MDYDNYIKYKKKYLNLKKINKNNKKLKGGGKKIDNITWVNQSYFSVNDNNNNGEFIYVGDVIDNMKSSNLYIQGTWDIKYVSKYISDNGNEEYLINALFNKKGDENKKMLEWTGSYEKNKNFTGSLRHLPMYVAEIYEFKINDYTNNKNPNHDYSFKFNEFGEIKNDCGNITVDKDRNMKKGDPNNIDYAYSCDNIDDTVRERSNVSNVNNIIKNKMVKNLYDLVYLKENPKTKIEDINGNNNNFYPRSDEENKVHNEVNIKNYCIEVLDKINKLRELYNKIQEIQLYDVYTSYIYKVNFDEKQKIIVIGDIHGSFHTFFRLFMRMVYLGIINVDSFEITEGYTIIFLGDILDRGAYQIETLYLIYNLLYKNFKGIVDNPKIIYNRGNHEETDYAIVDDENENNLLKEDKKKCYSDNISLANNILIQFFPVAIIVNNLYWLCHGGIPNTEKKEFEYYKSYSGNILTIDNDTTEQIMWNDFYNKKKNEFNTLRLGSIVNPNALNIGITTINDFLESGFKFIIRGHSDNFSNTWLLTNKYENADQEDYINNCYHIAKNKYTIDNFLYYHHISYVKRNYATLNLDMPKKQIKINDGKTILYPVLTISTNTADGRMLNRDSFIILRIPDK